MASFCSRTPSIIVHHQSSPHAAPRHATPTIWEEGSIWSRVGVRASSIHPSSSSSCSSSPLLLPLITVSITNGAAANALTAR